jgi:GT2 family glycosyltransferase
VSSGRSRVRVGGTARGGVISVVLVNFRGVDDTIAAVRALRSVDWPADLLEVVVVENGSGDDSARVLRAALPEAVIVESPENLGFAGGCNLGVAASSGEYLGFLNNDARPDAAWIAAAMGAFAEDPSVAAVASRVLDGTGALVDFVDAGLTWFGKGYKPFVGETAGHLGSQAKDVLFGTGSAMFVRRAAFLALGGFDERFFMFYEDVDLGWRLNLRGWRFRYVPESVAFHEHHGTVGKFGSFKEAFYLERNALFTLYKNLEQQNLDAALPAALALTVRRGVSLGGLDSFAFDYRRGADDAEDVDRVPRVTLASVFAVDQFVEDLASLDVARREVQSTRRVSDRALWSLFGRVDAVAPAGATYLDGYEKITSVFPVTNRPGATKVLVRHSRGYMTSRS